MNSLHNYETYMNIKCELDVKEEPFEPSDEFLFTDQDSIYTSSKEQEQEQEQEQTSGIFDQTKLCSDFVKIENIFEKIIENNDGEINTEDLTNYGFNIPIDVQDGIIKNGFYKTGTEDHIFNSNIGMKEAEKLPYEILNHGYAMDKNSSKFATRRKEEMSMKKDIQNEEKMMAEEMEFIGYHFTSLSKEFGPKNRLSCNYCKITLRLWKKSISNLRKHLKLKHPTVTFLPTENGDCSLPSMIENKAHSMVMEDSSIPIKKRELRISPQRKLPSSQSTSSLSRESQNRHLADSKQNNKKRHLKLEHQPVYFPQTDVENGLKSQVTPIKKPYMVVMEIPCTLSHQEPEASSTHLKLSTSHSLSTSFINSKNKNPLTDSESTLSPTVLHPVSVNSILEAIKPVPQYSSQEIDNQLKKLIYKEFHPFSLVESVEFKKLTKMLNPSYDLPSKKTISKSLTPLYITTSAELKVKLSGATAICITCIGWITINNTTFYAVTANFFNKDMNLHSNFIECSEFLENHSTTNISDWLDDLLQMWNIRNKTVAAVTSNDENINTAIDKLSIPLIFCSAHSLNLIVQNAIEDCIKDVVLKVKTIVLYFKKNSTALAHLHETQKCMKMPHVKLKQDVPNSWTSIFEVLNSVLKNKKPIISTLELLRSKDLLNLELKEWKILEEAVILLEVVGEATSEISQDKFISLSNIYILFRDLLNQVKNLLGCKSTLSKEIKNMGHKLLHGLTRWLEDGESSELISQALFLDPRFKKLGFDNSEKYKLTYSALAGKIRGMNASLPSPSKCYHTKPKLHRKSSSVWNHFDARIEWLKANRNPSARAILELDKYIAEPYIEKTRDPLEWWQEKKSTYPNLYEIAKRLLCIPAVAIPCDRSNSKTGQILCQRRSRLTTSKLSQILFLNSYSE